MIRRPLLSAGAVAACLFVSWGGSTLRATPVAAPANPAPYVEMEYGATALSSMHASPDLVAKAGDAASVTAAATASDGIAAIPLPPSAYPGMVGLATAALSVWRYRRRRR